MESNNDLADLEARFNDDDDAHVPVSPISTPVAVNDDAPPDATLASESPVFTPSADARAPPWPREASPGHISTEQGKVVDSNAVSNASIACVLCGHVFPASTPCGSGGPECSGVRLRCLSARQRKKQRIS